MSELIDRIPGQESMMSKLRAVVDTTTQIKARQRLTGRSGQLGYAVGSASDWDLDTSVPYSISSFQTAEWHVIFTGDGTQIYPIAIPQFDVRINGASDGNKMVFNPATSQYGYQDAAVEVYALDYGKPVVSYLKDSVQTAWTVRLFYLGKVTAGSFALRVKARAQASSNGSFSVVRIS